jgi:5-methylcytosine-specific restriction endonuclease McrA
MTKEKEKYCKRCEQMKSTDEFHRNKTTKDGYVDYCKPCRSEYRTEIGQYERNRFYRMKYDAKKAGVYDDLKMSEFLEILEKPEVCAYCGGGPIGKQKLAFEHVIPLYQKGSHSKGNLVKSCKSCNSAKHKHSLLTFLEKNDKLTTETLQSIIDEYVAKNGPTAAIYALSFNICGNEWVIKNE